MLQPRNRSERWRTLKSMRARQILPGAAEWAVSCAAAAGSGLCNFSENALAQRLPSQWRVRLPALSAALREWSISHGSFRRAEYRGQRIAEPVLRVAEH